MSEEEKIEQGKNSSSFPGSLSYPSSRSVWTGRRESLGARLAKGSADSADRVRGVVNRETGYERIARASAPVSC